MNERKTILEKSDHSKWIWNKNNDFAGISLSCLSLTLLIQVNRKFVNFRDLNTEYKEITLCK